MMLTLTNFYFHNLILLQFLIPFVAAPLCALFPKRSHIWIFVISISIITTIISFIIFSHVNTHGSFTYKMGGWASPIGIEFKIDRLNSFFIFFMNFIITNIILYTKNAIKFEIPKIKHTIFYSIFLFCMAGYIGILLTGDIFNLYVFLEISSISSYALIAMGRSKFSAYSAFQYLIFGTIAATFILLGIGMIYMITGSLNIDDIGSRIAKIPLHPIILLGSIMFIGGCLLKTAIFPVHLWLPNVYQHAPSPITVFLSATGSNVAIYIIIRFIFSLIIPEKIFAFTSFNYLFLILSLASILFGSIASIFQNNIKRILSFSTITQIGYIMLSISLGTKEGIISALIIIINHAIAKSCLFMIASHIENKAKIITLDDLKGLKQTMPYCSFFLIINFASLIGIPLTAGFISKYYLIMTIIDSNFWLIFPILISTIFGLIIFIKFIQNIMVESNNKIIIDKKLYFSTFIAIFILTITNIFLGINTFFNVKIATKILNSLIGIIS